MASDFKTIRADLQERKPQQKTAPLNFIIALVAVLVLGGLVGFLVLPGNGTEAPVIANTSAAPDSPTPRAPSKAALKKIRRAELSKYRETQIKLLRCTDSQPHLAQVYKTYSDRNLATYQAWHRLFDPTDALKKMSPLEAQAFALTQQNALRSQIMADINMDVKAVQTQIDPIACGHLNSSVQRRQLDLKPVPQL